MHELILDLQRQGYVKIPPDIFSLDAAKVADLKAEFASLFDGHYQTGIYPDEIHWRPGISQETATKEICNAWKASSKIAHIVCSKQLGSLACQLMGWKASRIGQDDVIHKPSQSNAVGFHQDGAYISDNFYPRENNCLTMWIALDDADEENGALQYAPGSHLWAFGDSNSTVADTVAGSSFHVGLKEDHLTSLRKAAQAAGKNVAEVEESVQTIPVKAGEMVVHDQDVWHGSGPNVSQSRQRRALVAHLIDGEVTWRHEPKPHYIYGRYYIRGESAPREDFFPVTYGLSDSLQRSAWLDEGA
jgi:phytanoyl-CoA hydroxylase